MTKKLYILLLFLFFHQTLFSEENNYLRDTTLINNRLILTFKYNLDSVKPLALARGGVVKYIYDIENGVLPKTKKIAHYKYKGVKAFRMGQYNKKYLRVVIESYSKNKNNYSINGKELTIYLTPFSQLNKKSSPKIKKQQIKKQQIKKQQIKKQQIKKIYTKNSYTKNSYTKNSYAKNSYAKNSYTKNSYTKNSYTKNSYTKNSYIKKTHAKKIIIIDPGHGGRDVGAIGRGIYEKAITLQIAKRLRKELQNRGYKVYMTRTYDKYLSLKERTEYANARNGDMFISIHANAAPEGKPKQNYQGVEVFHLSLENSDRIKKRRAFYKGKYYYTIALYKQMISSLKIANSRRLAKKIRYKVLSNVRKRYILEDKGVRRSDFWVLLGSTMPAVLIETGYLTHNEELRKLRSQRYQQSFAKGIANGVDAYYK